MNEPICKYMKTGIVHFMAFPETAGGEGPILDTIRRIAEDEYFGAIELTHIKDPAIRARARDLLDTARVTVAFGAQPILLSGRLNINDTDEKKRQEATAVMKEALDEAVGLGACGFAFLSGRYEEKTKEASYKSLVRSTMELCSYAKSLGDIKVVHEIFDYNVDKKSLIGPACLALRYAREITAEYDNFGLMVDLSHLPLIGEAPKEAIEPIKDYIVHAHIGNCVVKDSSLPGYGDLHPRFGFPGGENDVTEVMVYLKTLLDIGFLDPKAPPIVSFEVKPFGAESSEMVIANAKRTLDRAWALL